jgi:hypothetical protein
MGEFGFGASDWKANGVFGGGLKSFTPGNN